MVIAAKEERELADGLIGDLPVILRHDDVVMHVPVEVAGRAREAAAKSSGKIFGLGHARRLGG